MPSSTSATSASLKFPLYRADDETSALWTSDQSSANDFVQCNEGYLKTFRDRDALDAFIAELSEAIREGGEPLAEDAFFLASVGIALPEGPCYDPADFPLPDAEHVHPAVAATRAARALGKDHTEDIWRAILSGPNAVTILPPVALSDGQIAETIDRLSADFPGALVRTIRDSNPPLFYVLFTCAPESAA